MSVPPRGPTRAARQVQPVLVFLAGPNGSGKSTFFEEYLEDLGLPYVDVVAIYARGRLVSRHPPLPPWTRGLPGL